MQLRDDVSCAGCNDWPAVEMGDWGFGCAIDAVTSADFVHIWAAQEEKKKKKKPGHELPVRSVTEKAASLVIALLFPTAREKSTSLRYVRAVTISWPVCVCCV